MQSHTELCQNARVGARPLSSWETDDWLTTSRLPPPKDAPPGSVEDSRAATAATPPLGNHQVAGGMPTGSVQHHQNKLFLVALGPFGEKYAHRGGGHLGQHERVQYAIMRAHRGIGIAVLAQDFHRPLGSYARRLTIPA